MANGTRILLIQGHPDRDDTHFGHALAAAYAEGAREAGHEVRRVNVSELDFPLLRSKAEWEQGALPPALAGAQRDIAWCQHLVVFFPLWLGGMPALLKGLLEQLLRPGFAMPRPGEGSITSKLLAGRSARIVVTMGMPALVYRWYFRAHSLKALERSILGLVGFAPIQETLVGMIEGLSDSDRQRWLGKLNKLGRRGD